MKAILIDETGSSISNLENIICKYIPELTLVNRLTTFNSGWRVAQQENPDIVFIDAMVNCDEGVDILQQIRCSNFAVIWLISDYKAQAPILANEEIGCLEKPIHPQQLIIEVKKAMNYQRKKNYLIRLANHIRSQKLCKLALPSIEGYKYVDIDDILYIKASGSYSEVNYTSNKIDIVTRTIGNLQGQLLEDQFFRASRSYLINLCQVKEYHRREGGIVVMKDNTKISISKNKKGYFLNRMKTF